VRASLSCRWSDYQQYTCQNCGGAWRATSYRFTNRICLRARGPADRRDRKRAARPDTADCEADGTVFFSAPRANNRFDVRAGLSDCRKTRASLFSASWLRERKPWKSSKRRRLPNSSAVVTTFAAGHRHKSDKYLGAVLRSKNHKQSQSQSSTGEKRG